MTYDIPFVPSSDDATSKIVKLANVRRGERAIDLGAGDGKLVIALARSGAIADGVEIDHSRASLATLKIKQARLSTRAKIIYGSLWGQSLEPYDLIVLYGVPSIMGRLEKKIVNEAKPTVRIVSNFFTFPSWQPIKSDQNIHLYAPFEMAEINFTNKNRLNLKLR